MSSKVVIEVESEMNATQLSAKLSKDVTCKSEAMQALVTLLEGLESGAYNGDMNVKIGAVQASVAGTFSANPSANDTITVNGVAFTAKSSGATGNQFNIGANVTATAANLAAAVNASSTAGVVDVIAAQSSSGTITFYSKQAGKVGNAIQVSKSCANFTFSGSATAMSGGTQSTNVTYQYGTAPSVSY